MIIGRGIYTGKTGSLTRRASPPAKCCAWSAVVDFEQREDQDAGDGDVEPDGEGDDGDFAVELETAGEGGEEAGEDHGDDDGGEDDVADEDKEVDRADGADAGEYG